MPALYLMELGAIMGVEGECFKVSCRDVTSTIPIIKVDSVLVFGGTQITTHAIAELLERDIPTTFLSSNGRYYGRLASTDTKAVELKVEQYKKLEDNGFRTSFAKACVKGKILNSLYILKNLNRERKIPEVAEGIKRMYAIIGTLEEKDNLESIRGCEGSAAAMYFSIIPLLLKNRFGFSGRNRRPPKDPLNSLLSFIYTLLMYSVYTAVSITGLDPAIGYLHEYTDNRPALPLDLMEEFRALFADQVIIDLINHSMIDEDDFYEGETEDKPVLINTDLRRKVVERFEKRLSTQVLYKGDNISYRRGLEMQARSLVRYIRTGEPYTPFIQQ